MGKDWFRGGNWILFKNIHYFWEKIKFGKKIKWRPKTKIASGFFLNRNSTETPSSGFVRNIYLMQICL
jgi:hypothetical protein